MDTLQHENVSVQPTEAFYSEDQKVALEFYAGQPTEEGNCVIAYQRKPVELDSFDATALVSDKVQAVEDESILGGIGFNGDLVYFGENKRYVELAALLGYYWQDARQYDADSEERWIEFRYPSPMYLNKVLEDIEPGVGLRFEEYQGGKYTAVEHAEALLDDKILIAGEHPYQLHDHAAHHVLGYIGLDGELLERLQDFARAYLARYKAELELPPVPHMDSAWVRPFLHPAHEVLKGLVRSMDNMSGRLGAEIFNPEKPGPGLMIPYLESAVTTVFHLRSGLRSDIPGGLIDEPGRWEIEEYVWDIKQRYARLAARVVELAA